MPVNGNNTKRSAPMVMGRLAMLVRPLAGYMALAVTAGLAGQLYGGRTRHGRAAGEVMASFAASAILLEK